jgi:hypothetical protein
MNEALLTSYIFPTQSGTLSLCKDLRPIKFGCCECNTVSRIDFPDKKPHKCPLCHGEGTKIDQTTIAKCRGCDGNGIVWG